MCLVLFLEHKWLLSTHSLSEHVHVWLDKQTCISEGGLGNPVPCKLEFVHEVITLSIESLVPRRAIYRHRHHLHHVCSVHPVIGQSPNTESVD